MKIIDLSTAIKSLYPNSAWSLFENDYSTLNWMDESISKPTEQQLNEELLRLQQQQPLDVCKTIAKEKIAATDWAVLSDVGLVNQPDFIAYRAALRALIINPVADPVWPTEPTPEWG